MWEMKAVLNARLNRATPAKDRWSVTEYMTLDRWRLHPYLTKARRYLMICACVGLIAVDMPILWSFTVAMVLSLEIIARRTDSGRSFTVLDFALLLFYISSILSTLFAYDTAVALPELGRRSVFLLLFLAFSLMRERFRDVLMASAVGMLVRCIGAIIAFSGHYREWLALKFGSLSTFRSFVTLTADGEKPGNLAAIYIISIALAMLCIGGSTFRKRAELEMFMASAGLSAICVLLSFSRALYISSLICIVLCALGGKIPSHLKSRSVIIAFSTALVIVGAIIWRSPILNAARETATLQATLSQQRSADSRLLVTKTALHLAPKSGAIGVGLGNYALALRRAGMNSQQLLTTHPFNSLLDVTIEQGIVGAIAFLLLVSGLAFRIIRRIRTSEGKALLGGLCGLSVFSMGQTFVIADQATAVLIAVFCAAPLWSGEQNA